MDTDKILKVSTDFSELFAEKISEISFLEVLLSQIYFNSRLEKLIIEKNILSKEKFDEIKIHIEAAVGSTIDKKIYERLEDILDQIVNKLNEANNEK